ncbi:MAG: hypothetical protein M3R53_05430 [Candidatus Eremiobacteraeota bacterium]|nr:hypothetical protein [Candidatus Eremiobacteraeota bacterium]
MPFLLGAFAFAAFLVAQPQPSPAPQSSPSPLPSLAPSTTPNAGASATPVPVASQTPLYKFVYRATPSPVTAATTAPSPANAPSIDEIDLNDSTIVTPGALHLRVLTSDAVVSVTAETLGRSVTIPLRERGTFAYDGFLPAVPFYLRNQTYDVRFVASAQDGRTALVTIPLTLK